MRKIISILVFCLIVVISFAQSDCDAVREENKRLRSQLGYEIALDSATIKSFSRAFEVKLLSCKGSKAEQTVKIEFLITQYDVHQELCMKICDEAAKAFDFQGNEILPESAGIGALNKKSTGACTTSMFGPSSYVCNKLPTEVPVKVYIVFKDVLPSTKYLKFVTIRFDYKKFTATDNVYQGENLEIRNLKIKW
jgi:hypothetical protein